MSKTSDQLLKILLECPEKPVSGEWISQQLGVSRTAIWKNINVLREQGFAIEASTNSGYLLTVPDNVLSEQLIKHNKHDGIDNQIIVLDSTSSTNSYANELIFEHKENLDGTVVFAREQTAGMGRLGRDFSSPKGEGIYMSMIIAPKCPASQLSLLTSYCGLAVCRALERVCNVKATIKWPNDIIINNRKVCGILTKLAADGETGQITHAVVGIGVNVLQSQFEKQLEKKAISLLMATGVKYSVSMVAASIIEELNLIFYTEKWLLQKNHTILEQLRERSCTLGKTVDVITPLETRRGVAEDIGPDGALIVRFDTGTEMISCGEVSVRGVLGYSI